MRIVGGDLKGRKLEAPAGRDVRPTSDRAREGIFNILLNGKPDIDFQGITVLDGFAGTGALGLEALSRGAAQAVFMESNPASVDCIRANAEAFKVDARCLILRHDALHPGRKPFSMTAPAGLVFLDPPYQQGLIGPALVALRDSDWLADGCVMVIETEAKLALEIPDGYNLIDSRKYGAALVTFLRKE
ncbi:MAG: 16S rRNA (guanine(966)-N(2))-methyltransferase RsmD [Rhodospirillales bacterium]|jgi:16S rRNA (guanine966-N2)-methyltransferase|nr:16S rRNA (guanine(966)-N(2))-methyltransferase RsmD [Rhodospirillales bacterium]